MPLAAGADRNRRDARRGRTPLHCACENGKLRCVDALLAREASVVQADHANRTCVDLLREASLPALMICARKSGFPERHGGNRQELRLRQEALRCAQRRSGQGNRYPAGVPSACSRASGVCHGTSQPELTAAYLQRQVGEASLCSAQPPPVRA